MNKTLKSAARVNRGLTIDDIDPSLTPSLVGYWKCDEGEGDTILDYSGNDYHLEVGNSWTMSNPDLVQSDEALALDAKFRWNFPGYVSFGYGVGMFTEISKAPLLKTGTNQIIVGCEITYRTDTNDGLPDISADFDIGTYWAGSDSSGIYYDAYWSPAAGYNLLAWGITANDNILDVRVNNPIEGLSGRASLTQSPSPSYPQHVYISPAAQNAAMANKNSSFILNLDPGSTMAIHSAVEGKAGTDAIWTYKDDGVAGEVLPTTLGAQAMNGVEMFGARAQNQFPPRWAIKNLYVWSFPNAPQHGTEKTAQWMALNHGKIPSWLIGK